MANTYIVMPLRGPTCKIARFQAELKFQVGPSVAKKRILTTKTTEDQQKKNTTNLEQS